MSPSSPATVRLPVRPEVAAAVVAVPPAPAAARVVSDPDRHWDPLLVCTAAYILTAVGRIHQLFPVFEALRPALLVGGAAILLYAVDGSRMRRLRLVWTGPTKWLLALLAWAVLSIPGALVQGESFELVVHNFSKTVLMVFVVAGSVRGTRDVERLAVAYLAGAAIYAAVVLTRFDLGVGADWRLGDLYYYDANDLATFLVTALPLGIYFLYGARRAAGRVVAAAALVLMTIVFVQTGSRGGFIALLATGGFILLRYSAIRLRHRIGAVVLVLLALFGAASDRYWEQMTTILEEEDYNRTEESGRMQIWERGIGYMRDSPIVGVGAGNFQTAEGTISPLAGRQAFGRGVRWNASHNSYIQAGAELGVPGLIFFVSMIASSLLALGRLRQRHRSVQGVHGRRELGQAISAALIGFAVGAFFLSLAYAEMLYALVALAVALVKTAPARTPAPSGDHHHVHAPTRPAAAHCTSH